MKETARTKQSRTCAACSSVQTDSQYRRWTSTWPDDQKTATQRSNYITYTISFGRRTMNKQTAGLTSVGS